MAKIGEIGIDTPSGVVKLPVFDTGDSGSSVFEMWRVDTPSGVGFVPMVATGSGNFPYIRMDTAQGILEAHDAATLSTGPTPTPTGVVDSFEDGDMSEYSGNTNDNVATTGGPTPIDGSYVMQSNNGGYVYSRPGDGLGGYPVAGNTFEYYTQWESPDSFHSHSFIFGLQDGTTPGADGDFYLFGIADRSTEVTNLNRFDDGSNTEIARVEDSTSSTYSPNTWYRVEIIWTTSGIDIDVYENSSDTLVESITTNDTTYQDGGIGFRNNSPIYYYADYIRITS